MAKKKKDEDDSSSGFGNSVTAPDELRDYVERFEGFEADKRSITEDQKELMAEAKGRGWDTKLIRRLVAERKRDPGEIEEEEAVLDLYRAALGMVSSAATSNEDEDENEDMV